MKYDNSLEKVNEFVTPPGNLFETLYSSKVMPDGTIELVESGKKDIKQEINSWREHTDMAWILRQMAAGVYEGNNSLMYGDFTKTPANMAEAFQVMIDAEAAFYKLDPQVRNKFDNDFRKWLVIGNSDPTRFSDLMGFAQASEVIENEQKEGVE